MRGVASGTYHHNKPDRTARYRIFEIDDGGKFVSDYVRVWNARCRHVRGTDLAPLSNLTM